MRRANQNYFLILKKQGFTITELVVAIGLTAIVGFMTAGFYVQVADTKVRNELATEAQKAFTRIQYLLLDPNACWKTFRNVPLNTGPNIFFNQILNTQPAAPDEIEFTVGTPLVFPQVTAYDQKRVSYDRRLSIQSIAIRNYTLNGGAAPGPGKARLDIDFLIPSVLPGFNTYRRSMEINLSMTSTHTVDGCSAAAPYALDDRYIKKIGLPDPAIRNGTLTIQGNLEIYAGLFIDPRSGNLYAEDYYLISDKQLKTRIQKITNALEKIKQLGGYEFTWKKSNQKDWGVLAQEVEKVAPHLVSYDSKTNTKSVNYSGLVALLIESYKEIRNNSKQLELDAKKYEDSANNLISEFCGRHPKEENCITSSEAN